MISERLNVMRSAMAPHGIGASDAARRQLPSTMPTSMSLIFTMFVR